MLALGQAGPKATLIESPTAKRPWVAWRMADGGLIRVDTTSILIWKMSAEAAYAAAQRAIREGWTTVATRGHEEGRVTGAAALHGCGIHDEDADLRTRAATEVQGQRQSDMALQEAVRKAAEKRKADEASQAARDAEAARLAAKADEKRRAAEKQEADKAAKAARDAEAVRLAKADEERRMEEMRQAEQARLLAPAAPQLASPVAAPAPLAPTPAPKKRPPGLAR
jgi:hypothetical protein